MLFSEKCADPDEKSYYACGSCFKYSNIFVLTLCMLSNFVCPKSSLNLTDLSPSGPARRLAEPDLGLNCLYDQSQTFSF